MKDLIEKLRAMTDFVSLEVYKKKIIIKFEKSSEIFNDINEFEKWLK